MAVNMEKKEKSFSAVTKAVFFSILVVAIGFSYRTSEAEDISSNDQYIISGRYSEILPLTGHAMAPESLAFDPNGGGPYTGVSDGRILKWEEHQRRWVEFATTSPNRDGCEGPHNHHKMEHICGRPMGLKFNQATGDLYIADAYMGLLKVGPQGGLASQVATKAEGIPFRFLNGLDIDQSNGLVYFSQSSSQFDRRQYLGVLIKNDKSGRIMKYDPETNQVTVLVRNLLLPNGVALSIDRNYLIASESGTGRILKCWIETAKAGSVETFAQLGGFVDNVKLSPRGGFWVGIPSQKKKFLKWAFTPHSLGNVFFNNIPLDFFLSLQSYMMKFHNVLAKFEGNYGVVVRFNEEGEIVETFVDKSGSTSEVLETDEYLWIGNVNKLYLRRFKF